MPARRIPIVWSNPKAKDQKYLRYDPASKRVAQIGCCICKKPPASPFELTSWTIVGSGPFNLQAFWTSSLGAVRYTVNFLSSDTHPVLQSSSVLVSYPNVNSGDLLLFTSDITCTYFAMQIIAFNECDDPTYSNIVDGGATDLSSLYKPVAPVTASLSFDASNIIISFPDGYNVSQYDVSLYDVTAGDFALTQPILSGVSVNTSPFSIPYSDIVPFAVSDPPLITGHQYRLIITVINSGSCTVQKEYSPVTFTQVFPS